MGELSLINFSSENSIGGNCLLLYNRDYSLLLDMGLSLDALSSLPTFPRDQFVYFYPKSLLFNIGLFPVQYSELIKYKLPDTIIVSHPHIDHYGALPLIEYSGREIITGKTTYDLIEKWLLRRAKSGEYDYIKNQRTKGGYFYHTPLEEGKICVIKKQDWEIHVLPVPHSTVECFSFVVLTPNINIYYTGDFLDWVYTEKSITFNTLDYLKEKGIEIDILITEGTTVGRIVKYYSESEIIRTLDYVLQNTFGNTFIEIPIHNFRLQERVLTTLRRISKERNIRVSRTLFEEAMRYRPNLKDIYKEYVFVSPDKVLPRDIIIVEGGNFGEKLKLISEIQHYIGEKPSTYFFVSDIESVMAQGLEIDKFIQLLKMSKLDVYYEPVSGHIPPLKLWSFIDKLNPKMVIPVHSNYEKYFERLDAKVDRRRRVNLLG